MARKSYKSKSVELVGVDAEPVVIQVQPSRLSARDQLAVDLLLELAAQNGKVAADVVTNVIKTADAMAEGLGWES